MKLSMTGRELITHIQENHLEDAPIYEDGKFIGFMTEGEAAAKFGVGIMTLRVWINRDLVPGVRIGDSIFIPQNATRPEFQ